MRILLIHDSLTLQRILRTCFAAEVPEATVMLCRSGEAIALLREQQFDLIISGIELNEMDGFAIHHALQNTRNRGTPFVALTSNRSAEQIERFAGHGIEHHLLIPFHPFEIARLIRTVYDPRHRRAHQRYAIPGTAATIYLDDVDAHANVINLSAAGLLCEMSLPEDLVELFRTPLITLSFPPEFDNTKVAGIRAGLLRLQVIGWTASRNASMLRAAWTFLDLPGMAQEMLAHVLTLAHDQLLRVQADLAATAGVMLDDQRVPACD